MLSDIDVGLLSCATFRQERALWAGPELVHLRLTWLIQPYTAMKTGSATTKIRPEMLTARSHTVDQRLARRLMVISDCLAADTLEVTQEQLSIILDRHRNRISEAGIVLRNMGLVENARSQLTTSIARD